MAYDAAFETNGCMQQAGLPGETVMTQPVLSFEEVEQYLNEAASELPSSIFKELNGGIVLLPETMPSKESVDGHLYTLGMYHYDPYGLGRYIAIYYGSFLQVARGQAIVQQHEILRDLLHHELTHHIESLAGVRDLEVQDELFMQQYHAAHPPQKPSEKPSFWQRFRRKPKSK